MFNEGEPDQYYAAKSLDDYRQLYRTFRGDRDLQKVHERAPMICTWDDHEFTNDCHRAIGIYFGGTVDETESPGARPPTRLVRVHAGRLRRPRVRLRPERGVPR